MKTIMTATTVEILIRRMTTRLYLILPSPSFGLWHKISLSSPFSSSLSQQHPHQPIQYTQPNHRCSLHPRKDDGLWLPLSCWDPKVTPWQPRVNDIPDLGVLSQGNFLIPVHYKRWCIFDLDAPFPHVESPRFNQFIHGGLPGKGHQLNNGQSRVGVLRGRISDRPHIEIGVAKVLFQARHRYSVPSHLCWERKTTFCHTKVEIQTQCFHLLELTLHLSKCWEECNTVISLHAKTNWSGILLDVHLVVDEITAAILEPGLKRGHYGQSASASVAVRAVLGHHQQELLSEQTNMYYVRVGWFSAKTTGAQLESLTPGRQWAPHLRKEQRWPPKRHLQRGQIILRSINIPWA